MRLMTLPNSRMTPSFYYCGDRGLLRSSPSEVYLGKGVLKLCSKFTGEHSCHKGEHFGLSSPVNLLHIFRTTFPKISSASVYYWKLLFITCLHVILVKSNVDASF